MVTVTKVKLNGESDRKIGVQIVVRHWREDIVLAVMKIVEEKVRKNPDYPRTSVVV